MSYIKPSATKVPIKVDTVQKVLLKILMISGFLIFGLFAVAQYNDPDALVWIALYSYAAFLSLIWVKTPKTMLALIGLMMYAVALWIEPPSFSNDWIKVETSREGNGLLICAVWMAVLLVVSLRKTPASLTLKS
jgi:hypothetical protein